MNCASELSSAIVAGGSTGRRRKWIASSIIPEEMWFPIVRLWRACACGYASRIVCALSISFTVGGWNRSNILGVVSTLSFRFLVAMVLCRRVGGVDGDGGAFAFAFQIDSCDGFRC